MSNKYIQDQPESQIEHKTATELREDETLPEHITDSMRNSQKMYHDADDDETPAIARRVELGQVGAATTAEHRIKFDTDPELEAQVAAEREQHEKESAARAKAEKLERKAAKAAVRNSDAHQTNAADEKLYPDAKPKFDPDDEKYWRQQMNKNNPLPKQTRIESIEDDILSATLKQSIIIQVASIAILAIGIILQTTPLPNIFGNLAIIASIVCMAGAAYILYRGTIGRKLKNILPNQRNHFLIATIIPGVYARYLGLIAASMLSFFDFMGIITLGLQFMAMLLISAKYYEYLARYGIQYDIKMTLYTFIFTAPAILIGSGNGASELPWIMMSVYLSIFKLIILIYVPDRIAGRTVISRFKSH